MKRVKYGIIIGAGAQLTPGFVCSDENDRAGEIAPKMQLTSNGLMLPEVWDCALVRSWTWLTDRGPSFRKLC